MDYGLWNTDCGFWIMDYGIWIAEESIIHNPSWIMD